MRLGEWYRRWQQRRHDRTLEQYAHLSDDERAKIDQLRDEHNPFSQMVRGRAPTQQRDRHPDRF